MRPLLLLPYAINSLGERTHIADAQKCEKYYCPICKNELRPKQGKIRTHHFAHKRGEENHCSESYLHKMFKEKAADFIKEKISNKEDLCFEWKCSQCGEIHRRNLLKKAVEVTIEKNLGDCIPDIALLDNSGKVIIAIEIVVTHKPEPQTMRFYRDNKIACLQIEVERFDDCNIIEEKISKPIHVNLCPNPICEKCGRVKTLSNNQPNVVQRESIYNHNTNNSCMEVEDRASYICKYCICKQTHKNMINKGTQTSTINIDPGLYDRMCEYREADKRCNKCGHRMKFRAGNGILDYYCYNCKNIEVLEIVK